VRLYLVFYGFLTLGLVALLWFGLHAREPSRNLALLPEICGDGIVNAGEECDDHNMDSNDGCTATCQTEYCGDGILQPISVKVKTLPSSSSISSSSASSSHFNPYMGSVTVANTHICKNTNVNLIENGDFEDMSPQANKFYSELQSGSCPGLEAGHFLVTANPEECGLSDTHSGAVLVAKNVSPSTNEGGPVQTKAWCDNIHMHERTDYILTYDTRRADANNNYTAVSAAVWVGGLHYSIWPNPTQEVGPDGEMLPLYSTGVLVQQAQYLTGGGDVRTDWRTFGVPFNSEQNSVATICISVWSQIDAAPVYIDNIRLERNCDPVDPAVYDVTNQRCPANCTQRTTGSWNSCQDLGLTPNVCVEYDEDSYNSAVYGTPWNGDSSRLTCCCPQNAAIPPPKYSETFKNTAIEGTCPAGYSFFGDTDDPNDPYDMYGYNPDWDGPVAGHSCYLLNQNYTSALSGNGYCCQARCNNDFVCGPQETCACGDCTGRFSAVSCDLGKICQSDGSCSDAQTTMAVLQTSEHTLVTRLAGFIRNVGTTTHAWLAQLFEEHNDLTEQCDDGNDDDKDGCDNVCQMTVSSSSADTSSARNVSSFQSSLAALSRPSQPNSVGVFSDTPNNPSYSSRSFVASHSNANSGSPDQRSCKQNFHCPQGLICIDGKCVQCTTSLQCRFGQICMQGLCQFSVGYAVSAEMSSKAPENTSSEMFHDSSSRHRSDVPAWLPFSDTHAPSPACTSNEQCQQGLVCTEGQCVPCASGDQCMPGLICVQGSCQQAPKVWHVANSCSKDNQCPSNLCLNGSCTECRFDSYCASELCVNGTCVACHSNQECGGGRYCQKGRCIVSPNIFVPFCGNALLDYGELCDLGIKNSNTPGAICRTDCSPARCGDGILDAPLEICDDGNNVNDDGCSERCQAENLAPVQQTAPPAQHNAPEIRIVPIDLPFTASVIPVPPATTSSGPESILLLATGASLGYVMLGRHKK
jgi:cysteine-rich repeat protein